MKGLAESLGVLYKQSVISMALDEAAEASTC